MSIVLCLLFAGFSAYSDLQNISVIQISESIDPNGIGEMLILLRVFRKKKALKHGWKNRMKSGEFLYRLAIRQKTESPANHCGMFENL